MELGIVSLVARSIIALGTIEAQDTAAPTNCNQATGTCHREWTDAQGNIHMQGLDGGTVIWTAVFEPDGDAHGENPAYGGAWVVDGHSGWFKSPKGMYCTRFGCGANPFQ